MVSPQAACSSFHAVVIRWFVSVFRAVTATLSFSRVPSSPSWARSSSLAQGAPGDASCLFCMKHMLDGVGDEVVHGAVAPIWERAPRHGPPPCGVAGNGVRRRRDGDGICRHCRHCHRRPHRQPADRGGTPMCTQNLRRMVDGHTRFKTLLMLTMQAGSCPLNSVRRRSPAATREVSAYDHTHTPTRCALTLSLSGKNIKKCS